MFDSLSAEAVPSRRRGRLGRPPREVERAVLLAELLERLERRYDAWLSAGR